MTTLEKIRAEIEQLQDGWFKETDGWWCYEKALQIIDKYADQEPTKEEQALLQKWRDNRGISIEDFEDAMNALQEPCEDTVSRKEIIEHYTTGEMANVHHIDKNHLLAFVEQLPPVRPQEPKTGHWEFFCQHWRKCSECGNPHKFAEDWDYCPNCGARMDKPKTRGWKADTIILDEDVFMSIPYERQESSGEK